MMDKKQTQWTDKTDSTALDLDRQAAGSNLKNKILRELVGLPSMPHVVTQALQIVSAEESSIADLARVVETDPAIAAKTLRLANSAYYGLPKRVSSIHKAAIILGNKNIVDIIFMAATSSLLNKTLPGYGLDPGALWRHSLRVAFGAKIISSKTTFDSTDDAFAAGLLHNIGKVAMDRYILEKKTAFDELLRDGRHTFMQAETRILGVNHSEIASELCFKWRIPAALCSALQYYPYPSKSLGNELAYTIHVADVLAKRSEVGSDGKGKEEHCIEMGAIEFLGLEEEELEPLMEKAGVAAEKAVEVATN